MSGQTSPSNRKSSERKPRNSASLANLRKGGGRPKGVPNKATAGLKELAREYTAEALAALVQIMNESESDAARVSAINSILDRGYGKPSQVIAGDAENPLLLTHRIELVPVLPK